MQSLKAYAILNKNTFINSYLIQIRIIVTNLLNREKYNWLHLMFGNRNTDYYQ